MNSASRSNRLDPDAVHASSSTAATDAAVADAIESMDSADDREEGDDMGDSDSDTDDLFFFESDHLALRGNADYTAVLRTIAILQTQRMQVTRNIDQLAASERRALTDPATFVRQLQAGTVQLPGAVTVAELPAINFDKYGVTIPDFVPDAAAAGSGGEQSAAAYQSNANSLTVRGRMFDQTKPETFNQLWTCEEQKRLEELLVEYPPEAIEMRRFAKIARALGNRTTKQVASRLQKFFKKLHSAGMPVPGRIPKSNRQYVSKATRMHKQALRSTTFFPANHVPYHIADEEDDVAVAQLDSNWYRRGCYEGQRGWTGEDGGGGGGSGGNGASNLRRTYVVDSGQTLDATAAEESDEMALILRLAMRIKEDKEREMRMEKGSSEHVGFKCDRCCEEPIIGTRWHCQTCAVDSVDLCSDCLLTQLQSADRRHPLSHRFVALRVSLIDSSVDAMETHQRPGSRQLSDEADSDEYTVPDGTTGVDSIKSEQATGYDYSYQDPNFMPQ